jgi:hypothetical protein
MRSPRAAPAGTGQRAPPGQSVVPAVQPKTAAKRGRRARAQHAPGGKVGVERTEVLRRRRELGDHAADPPRREAEPKRFAPPFPFGRAPC